MNQETFDWTTKISEDEVAFIVSDADKVVYVWNGQKASNVQKYKGGTLATKIKSLYQLYGYRTSTLNQGEEVGSLKAEIENLLGGKGTPPGEETAKGPPKAAPLAAERVSRPAPAPVSHAAPARAAHVESVASPRVPEPAADRRVEELEAELESEKKKSQHKLAKLKEDADAAKESFEKQIAELNAEIAAARKGTVDVGKYNAEIAQLKGEKDSLNVLVEGLKKELEQKEDEAKGGADADKKVAALQAELDGLKGAKAKLADAEAAKAGLERQNADLAGKVSSLEAEIAVLKAKAEGSDAQKGAAGEVDGLKKQVESLQKDLADERRKSKEALDKVAESEEKLKKLENKAASAKEESHIAQRELIVQKEAAKQMEGLDFASLDEVETKPPGGGGGGGAGLAFVNPYSGGELGGEIDPLTDLRSFLNTVDPSKPLDPELKSLLDIVSKKIESDTDILPDLQKIKKKVKDKKLESLLDGTIKKIKDAGK
ncbi:MAG: hypothetical protein JW839_06140 [Candidatus Lokiarchaeota archaeon]|nr:hypothetical protein [Candidatus Lokiarchaeota archaeon]